MAMETDLTALHEGMTKIGRVAELTAWARPKPPLSCMLAGPHRVRTSDYDLLLGYVQTATSGREMNCRIYGLKED